MKIIFLPMKKEWSGRPGKTLMEIASEVGIIIDGNCAGLGTCGKCKVRVEEEREALPKPVQASADPASNDFMSADLTPAEREKLSEEEIRRGYRLACCFAPSQDITVEVQVMDEVLERKANIQDVLTVPIDLKLPKQTGKNEGSSLATDIYGVAVDMGTTTVVGSLWNLVTGEQCGVFAETNPQGIYGADVISRIQYAAESATNLTNIHKKIIECVNEIIVSLCERSAVSAEKIHALTFCGNTTMCHLFQRVDPYVLARAPFLPVFTEAQTGNACEIGLTASGEAEYYLLPCIAGHVGSDITAGLLTVHEEEVFGGALMVDIGTNGELVLLTKDGMYASSTAAGPAFEGASILHGMRAAAGAIEKVKITKDEVEITTIHHERAVGICGSGIIDAVAELLKMEIIDERGRLLTVDKLQGKAIGDQVLSRLRNGENGREFVLAYGDGDGSIDIVITQKDIREIQMAKAAIQAGMWIMMENAGIQQSDLSCVYLAGAFGSHISIESAMGIGLIPSIPIERVRSMGNAAGTGVSMTLLSDKEKRKAEELAASIKHVELSSCTNFQDEYLKAMSFSERR